MFQVAELYKSQRFNLKAYPNAWKKKKLFIRHIICTNRGVSRVVEACFNRLIRVRNVEPFAYEDEWSFSLLGFCTPVSKMGTSSRWEVNSIDLSND